MLANFYIPSLSNDMKLAVQKNHLGGQILYRIPGPLKKNGVKNNMFVVGNRGKMNCTARVKKK